MLKVFGKLGKNSLLFIFAAVIFSPIYISGQDLGSSSGIFRSPNAPSKSNSSNSTSRTKPKTSAAKKPTPRTTSKKAAERTRNTTKTTKPRETVSRTNAPGTVNNPQPQSSIVITVGDKTNGNFDELFEQAVEEGNTARESFDFKFCARR
jgi:hypothetical protein